MFCRCVQGVCEFIAHYYVPVLNVNLQALSHSESTTSTRPGLSVGRYPQPPQPTHRLLRRSQSRIPHSPLEGHVIFLTPQLTSIHVSGSHGPIQTSTTNPAININLTRLQSFTIAFPHPVLLPPYQLGSSFPNRLASHIYIMISREIYTPYTEIILVLSDPHEYGACTDSSPSSLSPHKEPGGASGVYG